MSFGNPAGLWLLLLIPLLIIIYIIRSRYEETPLSSTYIWKLSERFMKKTLPIQRFAAFCFFVYSFCSLPFLRLRRQSR